MVELTPSGTPLEDGQSLKNQPSRFEQQLAVEVHDLEASRLLG